MAQIINGREVSRATREEIKRETEELYAKYGRRPGLAVIIVGEDPASKVYVNNKKKACAYIGIESLAYELEESTTQDELLELVNDLNLYYQVNLKLNSDLLVNSINSCKILVRKESLFHYIVRVVKGG